jgi:hypothetical protein
MSSSGKAGTVASRWIVALLMAVLLVAARRITGGQAGRRSVA